MAGGGHWRDRGAAAALSTAGIAARTRGRVLWCVIRRLRKQGCCPTADLSTIAARAGVPTVVTNDVRFHVPSRCILQDVVTCVRHNCTIDDAGFRRERHADRYLKPPDEMGRLFHRYPEA